MKSEVRAISINREAPIAAVIESARPYAARMQEAIDAGKNPLSTSAGRYVAGMLYNAATVTLEAAAANMPAVYSAAMESAYVAASMVNPGIAPIASIALYAFTGYARPLSWPKVKEAIRAEAMPAMGLKPREVKAPSAAAIEGKRRQPSIDKWADTLRARAEVQPAEVAAGVAGMIARLPAEVQSALAALLAAAPAAAEVQPAAAEVVDE